MRRIIWIILAWTTLSGGMAQAAALPQRIISLKPNITETLFALGVGDRVVGVSQWCNYPAAAQKLPKVANYMRPNIEAVLALQPDLIISSRENAARRPIVRLEQEGIAIMLTDFRTVEATLASMQAIGKAVGAEQAAERLIKQLRETITTVTLQRLAERPRTLMLVDRQPIVAVGPESYLGELLTMAGGENVITAPRPRYPHLSREHVLAAKPDITIDITQHTQAKMHAARSIHIDMLRPGPRLGEGLMILQKAIRGAILQEPRD